MLRALLLFWASEKKESCKLVARLKKFFFRLEIEFLVPPDLWLLLLLFSLSLTFSFFACGAQGPNDTKN